MDQWAALTHQSRSSPHAPDDIVAKTFLGHDHGPPPGLAFGKSDDRLRARSRSCLCGFRFGLLHSRSQRRGDVIASKTNPAARAAGLLIRSKRTRVQCARIASSNSATMLVILIIGLTAGPAVSL